MKKYVLVAGVFSLSLLTAFLLVRTGFPGFPRYGWAKMGLASGYLAAAVVVGGLGSPLGRWLIAGFFCAWWGDFFLIGTGNGYFLSGLAAFLAGHLCYSIAFVAQGSRRGVAPVLWFLLAIPGVMLFVQIQPGIPAGLRLPVALYICVITAMVSLALGCLGRPGGTLLAVGAGLFYLSDIGVASHAFGGGPMEPFRQLVRFYFPGQYVLVAAIAVARYSARKKGMVPVQ